MNSVEDRRKETILISGKVDFRAKKITRDRHYIMIKGLIHQEDINNPKFVHIK